jgi:glutamine cyclotransferase
MQLLKLNSRVNYEGEVWTLTKIMNKYVVFSCGTSSLNVPLNMVIVALEDGVITHA